LPFAAPFHFKEEIVRATIKVQAILQNPAGTWETEVVGDYENPDVLKRAHKSVLGVVLQQGMWREISDYEHEYIPPTRVEKFIITVDIQQVSLGTDADVKQAASLQKIIELGKG
jgi:hypothetical protein